MLQPLRSWGILVMGLAPVSWSAAHADDRQVGTVTKVEGSVLIMRGQVGSETTSKVDLDTKLARYYSDVRHAAVGDPVENDAVLVTKAKSRARVIFTNGDQISIGPKSVFRMAWRPRERTLLELAQGALKAWILSDGPRANLQVRTRTAVIGVRGTEFAVRKASRRSETSLTVLRGKVGLKAAGNGKIRNMGVEIAQGQTAETRADGSVAARTTTAIELQAVEADVRMGESSTQQELPANVAKRIAALEKAAAGALMSELEKYEPEVFAAVRGKAKPDQLEDVLAATALAREEAAPAEAQAVEAPAVAMPDEAPREPRGSNFELTAGAGLSAGEGWGGLAAHLAADWLVWPRFGLHLEMGQLVAAGPPEAPPVAGESTNQLTSLAEIGVTARPILAGYWITQLTASGGVGQYRKYVSNGSGGFENPDGTTHDCRPFSLAVEERWYFSKRFALQMMLGIHLVPGSKGDGFGATSMRAGLIYAL
jgi:hypothetical protein